MSSHSHPLDEGFVENCACCDEIIEGIVSDAALMMDCWVNPNFRTALDGIGKVDKLASRMRDQSQGFIEMLSDEYSHRYGAALKEIENLTKELLENYPKNNPKKKEIVLKFIMSVFYHEFKRLPIISFSMFSKFYEDNRGKKPANVDTVGIDLIIKKAEHEAKIIDEFEKKKWLEKKIVRPNTESLDITRVSFGGDFSTIAAAIKKEWKDGEIPRPQDIFPLVGNLKMWA